VHNLNSEWILFLVYLTAPDKRKQKNSLTPDKQAPRLTGQAGQAETRGFTLLNKISFSKIRF
jgi:hypothetical protein